MKKRLLAIILCAVMIVTALPVMVMPAAADTTAPCDHSLATWTVENRDFDSAGKAWDDETSTGDKTTLECKVMSCDCLEYDIVFKPWTDATTVPAVGDYYLTCNVASATKQVANGNVLNFDLNGHTVTVNAFTVNGDSATWNLFTLWNGVVNLFDSSETKTGTITRTDETFSYVTESQGTKTGEPRAFGIEVGTVNMYGGTLTGFVRQGGSTVFVRTNNGKVSTFNMFGGTITGNAATSGGDIIWLHTNGSCSYVNIYGGTITGNDASTGGINKVAGTVNVMGGTFDHNDFKTYMDTSCKAFEVNADTYTVAPTADGIVAAAVRVGSNANSSGIQFKAIFNDSGLTDKGTATANFGVLVISKAKYDALATKDYASITGVTGIINAKGTTGIQGEGVYTMLVTINDIAPANYADELVAVKYVDGAIVGEAAVRSVKSVAAMALADPACEEAIKPILNAFVGN